MFHLQIAQYIEKEKLFGLKDKVLIALSGGADSVALLRVMVYLGYSCEAAHCNFRLRGEESDRDESFVRNLCDNLNIPLHVIHFDTNEYAAQHQVSIEMAARELRYDWFEKLRKELKADVVAVAHHRDDSVETLLLNLIRGTGINGLTGIHPKNNLIVRPLLTVSREDILAYLKEMKQEYVTDSTNLQDEYTRNKIRLNLLPMMETINPSIKPSLFSTASHLLDASIIYDKVIEEGKKRVITNEGISIEKLLTEPSPRALLFEILYPLGFNSAQADDIFLSLDRQSGRKFFSPAWMVVRDRAYLLIKRLTSQAVEAEEKPVIEEERFPYTPDFVIPRDKKTACFDADKLYYPLTLRKWQAGDRFVPFGMKGKKNVSDYLTDVKYSILQKESMYVLCSDEQIVWLVGERTDNRFRIDKDTKNVLLLRLI
ncbi:tRNA lysidine(34) synthetase TilS [uncultured Bacteroides sp.]|uniref:tRNA lysidine(34) synthetase TilS n=1 Tax=uncultured Bacteroides sp. TaxID=162156 RepID=UPI002AAB4894|nr:tRNA lysidine(34) synthetase TilS [uncultured Bacteroides sp.]